MSNYSLPTTFALIKRSSLTDDNGQAGRRGFPFPDVPSHTPLGERNVLPGLRAPGGQPPAGDPRRPSQEGLPGGPGPAPPPPERTGCSRARGAGGCLWARGLPLGSGSGSAYTSIEEQLRRPGLPGAPPPRPSRGSRGACGRGGAEPAAITGPGGAGLRG